tara:strand:- start:290 stop:649 length:360 start_codon:yes stop_codon:yes gene_type:complete
MKAFIAIHQGQVSTKIADFDTLAEAEAHAVEYGGFAAPLPATERDEFWIIDYGAKTITIDDAKLADAAAALAARDFALTRSKAYPSIGDQLDALWKGGQAQADMKVLVDKVKTDHPKPV